MMLLIILLLPFSLLAAPPFIFRNYEAFDRPFFQEEAAFSDTVFSSYSFESLNLFRGTVNYQSSNLGLEYRSSSMANRLAYRLFPATTIHLTGIYSRDRFALKAASVDLHLDGDNSRDLYRLGISQKLETGSVALSGYGAAGLTSADDPLPLSWSAGLGAEGKGLAFLKAAFSRARHREQATMSGTDIIFTSLYSNFERDSLFIRLGRDFTSGLRLAGWFCRLQETGIEDTLIFFSGTTLRSTAGLDCGLDIGSRRFRARVYGGLGTDTLRAHEAPGILALYAYAADTITGGWLSLSPITDPALWEISAGWRTARFDLGRSRVTLSDFVKSTNRAVIRTVPAKVYADGFLRYTHLFVNGRWAENLGRLWKLDFETELSRLPLKAALYAASTTSIFYVVGIDQENDTTGTNIRCIWGARPALSATFAIPERGWKIGIRLSQYIPWYIEYARAAAAGEKGETPAARFRFPSGFEAGLTLKSSF